MLDHNLVLKSDEVFLVGNIATDGSGERATGLYMRDTRHLSHFVVRLNGELPARLSVRQHGATSATVTCANPMIRIDENEVVLPQRVLVEEEVSLDRSLRVRFRLQNFTRQQLPLTVTLEFGADFRDLFDIRGFPRHERGKSQRPKIGEREIVLGYLGLDHELVETEIRFDRAPTEIARRRSDRTHINELVTLLPGKDETLAEESDVVSPVVRAAFPIDLHAESEWAVEVEIAPRPARSIETGRPANESKVAWAQSLVTTDNPYFNRVLGRAAADFVELQTTFPDGALPAAGIPWYVAPFGRDSLIAGLQTLHLAPERAAGTLRVLARLQGTKADPAKEEEPGKILHEMRYGEMARLHEVPHSPYFGTVDATPLWIWLFAETAIWLGDAGFYAELLPNAKRAIEWMERWGDLDGDGLIEYRNVSHEHGRIANQVWKDSYDSLNHRDGSHVTGPVAAVEVQGYAYAGYARLAIAASAFGEATFANELSRKAEALRARVEAAFWIETDDFYAQALDGGKQRVESLSSNPGHLLAAGLPSPDRAARMIERFRRSDFESGWGFRTLSAEAATYNPMSYHNGSIWPHDNSLIGAGIYRYGDNETGHHLTSALFDAAMTDPLFRLPELYCGFARAAGRGQDSPVAYPVSCSPQAWASGALPLLLRAMLGLEVDPANRALVVRPSLPDWLSLVRIDDLRALGTSGRLVVRRGIDGFEVETDALPVLARV